MRNAPFGPGCFFLFGLIYFLIIYLFFIYTRIYIYLYSCEWYLGADTLHSGTPNGGYALYVYVYSINYDGPRRWQSVGQDKCALRLGERKRYVPIPESTAVVREVFPSNENGFPPGFVGRMHRSAVFISNEKYLWCRVYKNPCERYQRVGICYIL